MAAAALGAFTANLAANLLQNGSFESPAITSITNFAPGTTALAGWSVQGAIVSLQTLPSDSRADGAQAAVLNAQERQPGLAVLEQAFVSVPGATYAVRFRAGRTSPPFLPPNQIAARVEARSLEGATLASLQQTVPSTSDYVYWMPEASFEFTATSSQSLVRILDVSNFTLQSDLLVDAVTVELVSPPPAPEIEVTGAAISIPNGDKSPTTADSTNLGLAKVGSTAVTSVFTIRNFGNANLELTGSPLIVAIGPNAAEFTVDTSGTSPVVAPGQSTTFSVSCTPVYFGPKSATVLLHCNDSDEATYSFDVAADATPRDRFGIIYAAKRSGNWDIVAATADPSQPHPLAATAAQEYSPYPSPDGKEIAYYAAGSPNRVRIMSADGSNDRVVIDASANSIDDVYGWTPDGQRILVRRNLGCGQAYVWSVKADGTGLAVYLDSRIVGKGETLQLDFSPAGDRVVFGAQNGCNALTYELFTAPLTGGQPDLASAVQLTNDGVAQAHTFFAPDGLGFVHAEGGVPQLTYLRDGFVTTTIPRLLATNLYTAAPTGWQPGPMPLGHGMATSSATRFAYRFDATSGLASRISTGTEEEGWARWLRAAPVAPHDIESGLVLHLECDGLLRDSSANHATIQSGGTISVPNRAGTADTAIAFDGTSNSFARVQDGPQFDTTDTTIALWMRTTGTGTLAQNSWVPLVRRGTYTNFALLWLPNIQKFQFLFHNGTQFVPLEAAAPMSDGIWRHVAASFSSQRGGWMRLYLDGSLIGEAVQTGLPASSAGDVAIGGGNFLGEAGYFAGNLDDIRVYNRALSPAQVASLSASGGGIPFAQWALQITDAGNRGSEQFGVRGDHTNLLRYLMGCAPNSRPLPWQEPALTRSSTGWAYRFLVSKRAVGVSWTPEVSYNLLNGWTPVTASVADDTGDALLMEVPVYHGSTTTSVYRLHASPQ